MLFRSQNILTDVKPVEAWVSSVLGLDPERVSETFSNLSAIQGINDHKKSVMKDMIIDYRKGIAAVRAGDAGLASAMFNRVKVLGHINGLTLKEFTQVYNRATNETPLDEVTLRNYGKIFGENF